MFLVNVVTYKSANANKVASHQCEGLCIKPSWGQIFPFERFVGQLFPLVLHWVLKTSRTLHRKVIKSVLFNIIADVNSVSCGYEVKKK